MARPQKNSGYERVTKTITFDPRFLKHVKQLAQEENLSIGEIFEKAVMHCEGVASLDAYGSEESYAANPTQPQMRSPHQIPASQQPIDLQALQNEYFPLLDKSLTSNLSEKEQAKMDRLWEQIQLIEAQTFQP